MKRRSFKKTLYNNVYSKHKPIEDSPTSLQSSRVQSGDFGIYRFVFASKMAVLAALLLCISLLLQPVASAYAQEVALAEETELTGSAANVTESVSIQSEEEAVVEDVSVDLEDSTPTATMEESAPTQSNTHTETTAPVSDGDIPDVSVPESDDGEPQDADLATATTSDNPMDLDTSVDTDANPSSEDVDIADATETTEEGVVVSTSTPSQPVATSDQDNENDSDSTASSSGEVVMVSSVQTDNVFAFGKNECTEVADGSFYCQKLSLENLPEDALFAAPDSSGDMEIFVVQEGIERKVTNNNVDDASPSYDPRSETLVWHRLVNDRYQIISYDIDSGEETQLTDTTVNNMEPTRSGDFTVWQRWVKNNWEIILFDGQTEVQLTTSSKHDIAPHVRGDLVIWNVRSSDGNESLMTYDITKETYNEISDPDGVSVANPRMLVMYEAKYQNGDTVMKGFDLVTGEIVPLESLPRELPDKIPNPETTGEVRALPTNPNTEKEKVTQEQPGPDPEPDTAAQLNLATSTPTTTPSVAVGSSSVLDLRPMVQSEPATTTSDKMVDQATIPDVVVPAFAPTTTDTTSTSTQQS